MRERSKGRVFRGVFWVAAAVAAIFSWLQFLYPPLKFLRDMPDPSLWELLVELLKPSNDIYPSLPFAGYLFLLLTVAFVVATIAIIRGIIAYIDHSTVGISVLQHDLTLTFEDAQCVRARLSREQSFHANRRGIWAYHSASSCDSDTGVIVDDSYVSQSALANVNISEPLIIRRNRRSIDVIEPFQRELPTSLFATFLPNWAVCLLHSIGGFKNVIVRRTGRIAFDDEFPNGEGILSIAATRYPISQVSLTVKFITGSEPALAQIKAFVVRENVVEKVAVEDSIDGQYTVYKTKTSSLNQEVLRMQWP